MITSQASPMTFKRFSKESGERLKKRRREPEKISYKMPAFTLDGDLIYFAAFKKHVGIYPPVRGDAKLNKELSRFRGEKGNLKFPLDEPIPYELIGRLVKFRIKEHLEKLSTKRNKKKR